MRLQVQKRTYMSEYGKVGAEWSMEEGNLN